MTYGYFQNTLWTKITGAVPWDCSASTFQFEGVAPRDCSAWTSQFEALLPIVGDRPFTHRPALSAFSATSTADVQVQKSLRPAAVWQEIVSYIKGSAEAMETEKVSASPPSAHIPFRPKCS